MFFYTEGTEVIHTEGTERRVCLNFFGGREDIKLVDVSMFFLHRWYGEKNVLILIFF